MKAVRIIISVVSWSWAALAVYALMKDRKELRHMQKPPGRPDTTSNPEKGA